MPCSRVAVWRFTGLIPTSQDSRCLAAQTLLLTPHADDHSSKRPILLAIAEYRRRQNAIDGCQRIGFLVLTTLLALSFVAGKIGIGLMFLTSLHGRRNSRPRE
jgi:hypothetical protein